jgi:bacteriocin-like protein
MKKTSNLGHATQDRELQDGAAAKELTDGELASVSGGLFSAINEVVKNFGDALSTAARKG